MNEQETSADIIAKPLKTVDLRFDICRNIALVLKIGRDYQNKDGYRGAHYDTVKLLCDAIEYQQEQVKAKTEVGDCAKLREALKAAKQYLDGYTVNILELRRTVDAALAAPPRNFDVGTAEEQDARLDAFCNKHYTEGVGCNKSCPCYGWNTTGKACSIIWAQMPYESEVGK